MYNLEKHTNNSLAEFDGLTNTSYEEKDSGSNLFAILLKRWKSLLLIFLILCAIGIPIIWFTVKPFYMATAAIRVSPVISNLLAGGQESIPMYRSFTYTQAELITSDKVLQEVAKDLTDRGIIFSRDANGLFEITQSDNVSPQIVGAISSLRTAILGGKLTATSDDITELIKISMKSSDPKKAAEIVNSFVRAYMAIVASEDLKDSNQQMTLLENKRRTLENEIKSDNMTLYKIAQEYGTSTLNDHQEIILTRVAKLQEKLTEIEMDKIELQIKMNSFQSQKTKDDTSTDSGKLPSDYSNADPVIQALAANVAKLEQELVVAKEQMVPTNPKLVRKEAILNAVKQRIEERRKEVAASQAQGLIISEKQIRDLLTKENANTLELGGKQLEVQNLQSHLNLSKELYDTVQRRIKELELENKQPAKMSVAYYANTVPFQDNRRKYTLAFGVFAMMCGMGLTLIRGKLDTSVQTPEDMTKHIDIRILGTTINRNQIKRSLWCNQLDDDYQTICANLGLMDGQGIPRSVVITSPCPREGKSTLAINLATNLAKLGKKVLLIDGDLRKPDIARMMNLDNRGMGLQHFMSGTKFDEAVSSTDIPGLLVLKAEPCEASNIYRLIDQGRTVKFLDKAKMVFDHIIIDSPPILVAVDALLWAKMVDGVILTSQAGQTKNADLKEALMRLRQINVKVFGAVLGNVKSNYTYHPYGYGVYVKSIAAKS